MVTFVPAGVVRLTLIIGLPPPPPPVVLINPPGDDVTDEEVLLLFGLLVDEDNDDADSVLKTGRTGRSWTTEGPRGAKSIDWLDLFGVVVRLVGEVDNLIKLDFFLFLSFSRWCLILPAVPLGVVADKGDGEFIVVVRPEVLAAASIIPDPVDEVDIGLHQVTFCTTHHTTRHSPLRIKI